MPSIGVFNEIDDTLMSTKLELSVDSTVLSMYTYSKSTNEVTIDPRILPIDVNLNIFNKGISETGTWSSRYVSQFSPSIGTISPYQLSVNTPDDDTISYSYICKSATVSGLYKISTDMVTINAHNGVVLPWENFNQMIVFFTYVSNLISKTQNIDP